MSRTNSRYTLLPPPLVSDHMAHVPGPAPRFHDVVTVRLPGRARGMRIVLTEAGPLHTLIQFFAANSESGSSSERKAARAVGLLYDYFLAAPPRSPAEAETFFQGFVNALRDGTIQADGTSSPPELFWPPCSADAVRDIVRHTNAYADWCHSALSSGAVSSGDPGDTGDPGDPGDPGDRDAASAKAFRPAAHSAEAEASDVSTEPMMSAPKEAHASHGATASATPSPLSLPRLNPFRPATFAERLGAMHAWAKRREASLLAHVKPNRAAWQATAQTRTVRAPRAPKVVEERPPHFPFEHTERLLWEGFGRSARSPGSPAGGAGVRSGGRRRGDGTPLAQQYALRDLMLVILQRFGGVRASEPFHLYVTDVEPDIVDPSDPVHGTRARVWLYHPEWGRAIYRDPVTGMVVTGTRTQYLQAMHGRAPRNRMHHDPEYAGWKDLILDDSEAERSEVLWYPHAWGTVFWRLYDAYLRTVLPAGLAHPYLFVNLRGDEDAYGMPYKLDSYHKAFARAVRRIGLRPQKADGTTSHGLRHAYAQVLERHGVSRKTIQVAMHHKSPLSQDVYTRASRRDVARELEAAHQRAMLATAPATPTETTIALAPATPTTSDAAAITASWVALPTPRIPERA